MRTWKRHRRARELRGAAGGELATHSVQQPFPRLRFVRADQVDIYDVVQQRWDIAGAKPDAEEPGLGECRLPLTRRERGLEVLRGKEGQSAFQLRALAHVVDKASTWSEILILQERGKAVFAKNTRDPFCPRDVRTGARNEEIPCWRRLGHNSSRILQNGPRNNVKF